MTISKELKAKLKAAFPSVKFSVRSDKSRSLTIEWTDGVTVSMVNAISSEYESISRCAYTGEILSGGNRYVSLRRNFSPDSYTAKAAEVYTSYGLKAPEVTVNGEYAHIAKESDVWDVKGNHKWMSWVVSEEIEKTDYTASKIEAVETIAAEEVLEAITEESAIAPSDSEVEPITESEEIAAESSVLAETLETLAEVLEVRRQRLEERTANRQEAYERLADKHSKESDRQYAQSKQISNMIPFGQPILVGHHSEKRHRRDVDRIHTSMGKSVEHSKTAEYYKDKLATMEANTSISSDDPDALIKLTEKLTGMEECQEYMKRINAIVRKVKKLAQESQMAEFCRLAEVSESEAMTFLTPDYGGRVGFPSYATANNNANMKRVKDRIEEIKKQHQAIAEKGESDEVNYPDIELKVRRDRVANRVQMIFKGKPSDAVRATLKANGFRWSPNEGAWQRQLNNAGIYAANQVIKFLQSAKVA